MCRLFVLFALFVILMPLRAGNATGVGVRPDTLSGKKLFDYFFLEAVIQREKGNADAAFELFRYCSELDPQAAETYFYLAPYYASLKDKERSLDCYRKAASLNPGNTFYMETLAGAYIDNEKYEEAIAVFEKLMEMDSERADILEILVKLYSTQKQEAKAISALERIESLEGKSESLSYAKSELYVNMGDKKAAVDEMRRLSEQYPYDMNYKGMYGDMLLMNGQTSEALDVFDSILAEEPGNSRAQMSLRTYYIQQGDTAAADSMTMTILLNANSTVQMKAYILRQVISEAEDKGDSTSVLDCFSKILAQPQKTADMAMMCASYMELKKMPEDSIGKILQKVLSISPDNSMARLKLLSYAYNRRDMDKVIEICDAARQYNPDEMVFYYYQGNAYYMKEDETKALETLKAGVSAIKEGADAELAADYYFMMGEIYHRQEMYQEAFASYDSCLQWKEDHAGCLNNYAYFLCLEGREMEKAERMAYRAIKIEPDNANSLDTYAWILFQEERYAEAKVYILQALQNDSSDSAVLLEHAGDIFAKNGEMEKSLEYWKRALKKDSGNKILSRKIKRKSYIKKK